MDRTQSETLQASSAAAHKPRLQLVTLGDVALRDACGTTVLDRSVPLALLTYLHASANRSASRDRIVDTFWATQAPERAYATLRQNIHRLRQTLGEDAIERAGQLIFLKLQLDSDRDRFLCAIQRKDFAAAITEYHGDFFPEFGGEGTAQFEYWAEEERLHLRRLYLQAVEVEATRALDQGKTGYALRVAREAERLLPESETVRRLQLAALLAAGDDLGLKIEVERLSRWLEAQGRPPDPATARLLRRPRTEAPRKPDQAADNAPLPALIGRDREFARLADAWRSARLGSPRRVHIEAPAGLGKTRLLTDFRNRLLAEGDRVAYLRAQAGEKDIPYSFAAELAQVLVQLSGSRAVDDRTAGLLVGLHPGLSSAYPAKPLEPSPTDAPRLRSAALGSLIKAVADEAPVALLLDDLHWMDDDSARTLSAICARLARESVLLVTATRPTDQRLCDAEAAVELALARLTEVQTGELLSSLGRFTDPGMGARVSAAMYRACEGSPLLTLERLQLAIEWGELQREQGRWEVTDAGGLFKRLGERTAIEERIASLPPNQRSVVLVLMLAGTPLGSAELDSVLPNGFVPAALLELERRGFLRRTGDRWELSHEEIGVAALKVSEEAELRTLHAALGRDFSRGESADRHRVRRAIRHLVSAGDDLEVQAVFRRAVRAARRGGDRTPPSEIAKDLLGDLAGPPRLARLVGALPWRDRARLSAAATIGAGLVMAAILGALAWSLRTKTPPDATLMIVDGELRQGARIEAIDLREDGWARADMSRPLRGRTIGRLPPLDDLLGPIAIARDGRIAFIRPFADSGGLEIALRKVDGSIQRVTQAHGDDIDPSWSPDGRWLVISTARWSRRGDEDADIAVVDPLTGTARPLTSGPDRDIQPKWSPDGTRILFMRQNVTTGSWGTCWIAQDGSVQACPVSSDPDFRGNMGWDGPDRVVEIRSDSLGQNRLVTLNLLKGTERVLVSGFRGIIAVSDRAAWILEVSKEAGNAGPSQQLFPARAPDQKRVVRLGQPGGLDRFGFLSSSIPQWLDSLVLTLPARVPVQVPSIRPSARGFTPLGREAPIPAAVLRWRSSDTAVAAVDNVAGTLFPRRIGAVKITVSAGGWATASTLVEIVSQGPARLLQEDWSARSLRNWQIGGDPLPVLSTGPGGIPGLLNNGDNTFQSSAYLSAGYPVKDGLEFDALASTPVSRPKWQRLKLGLTTEPRFSRGAVDSRAGCSMMVPVGEGLRARDQLGVVASSPALEGSGGQFPTNAKMRSGGWFRVRLVIFPDGSCGVAINGRPLWRSPPILPIDGEYHPYFGGQSVGTKILLGPFELWRGIRNDIHWNTLDAVERRNVLPAVASTGTGQVAPRR